MSAVGLPATHERAQGDGVDSGGTGFRGTDRGSINGRVAQCAVHMTVEKDLVTRASCACHCCIKQHKHTQLYVHVINQINGG